MNYLQAQTRIKELMTEFKVKGNGNAMATAELKAWNAEVDDCQQTIDAATKAFEFSGSHAMGGDGAPTPGTGGSPLAAPNRDNGKRLTFGTKTAAALATKMLGSDGLRAKALAPSGAAVTPQEFKPDPVALGRVAHSLLDVLPVVPHDTPQYAFLRQTTRTNNAAVVADYGVKPTSIYGVTLIEQSLAIVAHLSEPIPRYWLVDNAAIEGFISTELDYGLRVAVEALVVSQINATSGLQTQTYVSSKLAVLRKSMTRLEVAGQEAGFFLLHPQDWEEIELSLATSNAVEHLSLPYDAATRRLFGVPVVVGVSQTAGVSHTVAKGAVALDVDQQGTGVQWSETSNADDWSKNLIRARCEGRFATSVFSPAGVVVGDLAE